MGAGDSSTEGSGTQPGAGDTSAEGSCTEREDKWGRGGAMLRGTVDSGQRQPSLARGGVPSAGP
jgi:hypothetical protein